MNVLRNILVAGGLALGAMSSGAVADVDNTATASANYGAIDVLSDPSTQSVPVAAGAPDVQLTKTISEVVDTNGSGRVDAGDTVVYQFEVLNAGNLTLDEVQLVDEMVTFTTDTIGPLLPQQTDTSLSATYLLSQTDMDAGGVENSAIANGTPVAPSGGAPRAPVSDVSDTGSETEETPALDGSTDGDPTNDPTVLVLEQAIELALAKEVANVSQPFPYVFDITYTISMENTGSVTATNLVLTDDIYNQYAPLAPISVSAHSPTGILTDADLNTNFDGNLNGNGDASVLTTGLSAAPGETFAVQITVRVETPPSEYGDGVANFDNIALVGTDQAPEPFGSNLTDGAITPVSVVLNDADADGIVDEEENTGDHDGDGVNDDLDYDPTGYFYCEETGDILTGGSISVNALNGNQSAIRVVHDGANGFYQWYVTEPGTYQMSYTAPPTGNPSVNRVDGGPLDLSGFGGDAVNLGSNQLTNTGRLADFSQPSNPYHLTFEIEEGDPHVFNNNIPLRHCGVPELSVTKTIPNAPVRRADGRYDLSYNFVVTNVGTSRADNVQLIDNLATVFGAGRFAVVSNVLEAAPADFEALASTDYDGTTSLNLLRVNGNLEPNESVSLRLDLIVDPLVSDTYNNVVTVRSQSPLDGSPLDEVTAEVAVDLSVASLENELIITKSARPEYVRAGDIATFQIEVENASGLAVSGLSLVDRLPEGLVYRSGTARFDGVADEPSIDGSFLTWTGLTLAAGQRSVMTLQTLVSSSATPGDLTNTTWLQTSSGERVSEIAKATIRVITEPVFDCSDVIGRVFEDLNFNGHQDAPRGVVEGVAGQNFRDENTDAQAEELQQEKGEPGMPGVQISTATGTIITTDEYGHFSVPCAALPQSGGENFTLKVDERSLPTGYRIVTGNPRTMRLTSGIFTEMNFGAALGRVIEINLTEEAFDTNNLPVAGLVNNIQRLRGQIGEQHAVIKLNYYYGSEGAKAARARLNTVSKIIEQNWADNKKMLNVERSVFKVK